MPLYCDRFHDNLCFIFVHYFIFITVVLDVWGNPNKENPCNQVRTENPVRMQGAGLNQGPPKQKPGKEAIKPT